MSCLCRNPTGRFRAVALAGETDITYALDATFDGPTADNAMSEGARIALAAGALFASHGIEGDWTACDDDGASYVIELDGKQCYLEALPDTRDALADIPWHPGHEPKARRVSPLHLGSDK